MTILRNVPRLTQARLQMQTDRGADVNSSATGSPNARGSRQVEVQPAEGGSRVTFKVRDEAGRELTVGNGYLTTEDGTFDVRGLTDAQVHDLFNAILEERAASYVAKAEAAADTKPVAESGS